jgi:dolichol-phosphate mannosyltransferase
MRHRETALFDTRRLCDTPPPVGRHGQGQLRTADGVAMVHYSIILPQRNAARHVARLRAELAPAMASLGKPYELICVDDGSDAAPRQQLGHLLDRHAELRLLTIDPAQGIGAAIAEGVRAARGETLIVMEASGQYAASDIPRLARRLTRVDAVFGCRRRPPPRRVVRRLAQVLGRLLLRGAVRDPECLFWAARREAVADLDLSRTGGQLPARVARLGYRIGELHVTHWPLPAGVALDRLPRLSVISRGRAGYQVTEVTRRPPRSAAERMLRFDPPQPLDRRGPVSPDTPRGDRHPTL